MGGPLHPEAPGPAVPACGWLPDRECGILWVKTLSRQPTPIPDRAKGRASSAVPPLLCEALPTVPEDSDHGERSPARRLV